MINTGQKASKDSVSYTHLDVYKRQVQTFHEISDDKFISPEARMNINFVSQGLRRTAEPDSQAREQVEPKHMSRRPSTRSRHRD